VNGPASKPTEQPVVGVGVIGGITLTELSLPDPPPPQLINNAETKKVITLNTLLC
jgi:hypothetical protein